MKNYLFLIAFSSSAFAGTPENPCNPARGIVGKTSPNNIDSILAGVSRTGSDFINPVDFVTIPGISASSKDGLILDNPSQNTITGKDHYHLFNPTPDALLRDLSPDRPDATESPITVDAGRFALEMSLFDYRRDGGVESTTWGAINFKAGLTANTDLQTVFNLYDGTEGGPDGFGDVTLRLKHNIWGNDGGSTAFAVMPFIKIPTGELSNDEWEGGLILPFAMELSDTVGLGLMAEIDYLHNGSDYEFEFLHTAVLGVSLTKTIGAYAEYIGIWQEDAYEAYAAGGMNYAVSDDLILDFGIQAGLNSDSEDLGFFTGFTKRF